MKKLLSSLLCLAMVLGLTACGSSHDDTKIRVAVAGDFAMLDPAIVDDTITANVLAQMYEGLYKLDTNGNVHANVATDLPTVSADGLTYTITIKDGIKWSDGTALTANDFVYAWKRAACIGGYYSQFVYKIKGATAAASMDELKDFGAVAKDDHTIVITLKEKCAYFGSLLTNTVFYPLRQDVVEANGGDPLKSTWADTVDNPVNGAFIATAINSKDEIVLTKNADYHSADEVTMETLSFKVMTDADSQTNAFISGELDIADTINLETVNTDEELKAQLFAVDPFVCNYYILINAGDEIANGNEVFADKDIRKAYSMAINRENIIQATGLGDYAYQLNNLVPVGIPGVDGDYTTENGNNFNEGYNLAEAQKIMTSKGYSADNMLEVTYKYNDTAIHKNVAQTLQASLKEAYINLTLVPQEKETFFEERDQGKFETCRHAMTADFLDPMAYLSMYVGKDTKANTVDDAKYEALIAAAEKLDGDARIKKLAEAEEYLVSNYYVVPLFGYTDPKLKAANLEGVTTSPEGHYDLTRAKYVTE